MEPAVIEAVVSELKQRGIGYVVTDLNLNVTAVFGNPQLFRECDPTFIGLPLTEAAPELVGNESVLAAVLNEAAEHLQFEIVSRDLPDGKPIYVRISDLPYRDETGQIVGLVHLLEDISTTAVQQQQLLQQRNELALLKRQLTQTVDELTVANTELRRINAFGRSFIAVAAHQIGEPLTSIRGFLELLLDGAFGPFTDQQLVHLETVAQGSEQLQRATESLLGMLRIESKQVQMSLQPSDLVDLVDEALVAVEPEVQRKRIRILRQIADELPLVLCDANQTMVALRSLLQITTGCVPDDGDFAIRFERTPDRRRIRLSLECDSIGITATELQSLAVLSEQHNRVRIGDNQSNALDLYLALALLQLQDGEMYIGDATHGSGVLVVTLPVAANA